MRSAEVAGDQSLQRRARRGHRSRFAHVMAGLTLCVAMLIGGAQAAYALPAYAVTEAHELIHFDTVNPGAVTLIGPITGLLSGQIQALDFRPRTGRLYGVTTTRLYLIDPFTAVASLVSPADFPAALAGSVGMDFDPVSDTVRIVTSTGQNLRVNPATGVATTGTPTSVTGLAGVAYNNNFDAPTTATLFAIDVNTDALVRIGDASGNGQDGGVVTTIGPLNFDTDSLVAFDIAANDNAAWAVLTDDGVALSNLALLNLNNAAVLISTPIASGVHVRALAVLSRAVTLYGLTTMNQIVRFLSAVPGSLLPYPEGTTERSILGLEAGEQVIGIDVRPATGQLYGLTSQGVLLVIDPFTGQTSRIALQAGTWPGPPVEGQNAMDFDPMTDRLRIMLDTGQNLLVDPDSGAVLAETPHNVADLVGVAYTNNNSGAAATELFGLEASTNTFVRFATPATGVGVSVRPLGSAMSPQSGFDVAAGDGTGFLFRNDVLSVLHTLPLPYNGVTSGPAGGDARFVGGIGNLGSTLLRGLTAASPGRLRLTAAAPSVLENGGTALITIERIAGTEGPVSVRLRAQPGIAGPGDFTPGTFVVSFEDGETSRTVSIAIADDPTSEGDETVLLTLVDPFLGASLASPSAATLTIVDNDPTTNGAAPTVTITSPTDEPTYLASSLFLTLSGLAEDSNGQITSVTWSNDRGFFGTASTGPSAASLEWIANGVALAPGVNTITVTATDSDDNQVTDTIVVTVNELSYYLAEGATGSFFDLDLLLANPSTEPVNVTVTFLKPQGQGTVVRTYTLAPTSRRTINVETIPGLEAAEISTIVTGPATLPIIVERTMRWNGSGYGSHTDKASVGASSTWYFAEGAQGTFFTYLLLANPHDAANDVSVRYLREGTTAVTRTYNLAPLQRFTVDIGADADLVNQAFGMEVTFQLPGIAERAMYFGLDPLWIGGHESIGVTSASREWFLAEGATGPFFETFVLFANPGTTPATVTARYLPADSAPVERTYTVAPRARLTVNIEPEDPSLANVAVATQVTSDVPILVERAQYWPDPAPSWIEAHNSFGMTALGTRWGLAEGRVGGSAEYQTYILLANPGTTSAPVTIVFLRENGTTVTKQFNVPPASRFNVAVGGELVPEITNESFGAVITSSLPIAVERAMYSNAGGTVWQAGSNATGTRLP